MAEKRKTLNAEQLQIVNAPPELQLVIASPGSGKTETLIHRAEHLVKTGFCKPEEILVFSYTNEAANEIGKRIASLVKNDKIKCSTVHSFAFNECIEYTGSKNAAVVDDNYLTRISLEERFVNALLNGIYPHFNEEVELHREALEAIQTRIREDHTSSVLSDISSSMKALSEKPEEEQDPFYVRYQDSYQKIRELILSVMIEEGVYTFETMLIVYRDLLTSPSYIDYQTQFLKRYKVLLVDEYQDCSDFVDAICVAIANLTSTATFCGDPCQAIYSKSPNQVFSNLKQWNLYNIETGYRMSQNILDVSNFIRRGIVTNEHLNLTGVAATARTHEAVLKHLNTPGEININVINTHIPKPILFEQMIINHLDAIGENESIVFMAYTNRDVKVINDIISRQGWEKTVDYSKADELHGYKHMACLLYYKLLSDLIVDDERTGFAWKQVISAIRTSFNDYAYDNSSRHSTIAQFIQRNTVKSLIYRSIDILTFHMISMLSAIGSGKAIPSNVFRGRLLATINETIEDYLADNPSNINLQSEDQADKEKALYSVFTHVLTTVISPEELARIAVGRSKQKENARNKISSLVEEYIESVSKIGNFNTDAMSEIITLAHEWFTHRGKDQKPKKETNTKKTNMEHPALEHLRKLFGTFSEQLRRASVRSYVSSGDGIPPEHNKLASKLIKSKNQDVSLRGKVVADTMHSRKGLEYDRVVIFASAENLPGGSSSFQRRCLEYVCLTRARKSIDIYYNDIHKKTPLDRSVYEIINSGKINHGIVDTKPTQSGSLYLQFAFLFEPKEAPRIRSELASLINLNRLDGSNFDRIANRYEPQTIITEPGVTNEYSNDEV